MDDGDTVLERQHFRVRRLPLRVFLVDGDHQFQGMVHLRRGGALRVVRDGLLGHLHRVDDDALERLPQGFLGVDQVQHPEQSAGENPDPERRVQERPHRSGHRNRRSRRGRDRAHRLRKHRDRSNDSDNNRDHENHQRQHQHALANHVFLPAFRPSTNTFLSTSRPTVPTVSESPASRFFSAA